MGIMTAVALSSVIMLIQATYKEVKLEEERDEALKTVDALKNVMLAQAHYVPPNPDYQGPSKGTIVQL